MPRFRGTTINEGININEIKQQKYLAGRLFYKTCLY
jgi:hypothetical protein